MNEKDVSCPQTIIIGTLVGADFLKLTRMHL
jgi:hypothetical protein